MDTQFVIAFATLGSLIFAVAVYFHKHTRRFSVFVSDGADPRGDNDLLVVKVFNPSSVPVTVENISLGTLDRWSWRHGRRVPNSSHFIRYEPRQGFDKLEIEPSRSEHFCMSVDSVRRYLKAVGMSDGSKFAVRVTESGGKVFIGKHKLPSTLNASRVRSHV